jgi:RNAse (barnase) inhibitor barstar
MLRALLFLGLISFIGLAQAGEVARADLPIEARATLRLIAQGGPFPNKRDLRQLRETSAAATARPLSRIHGADPRHQASRRTPYRLRRSTTTLAGSLLLLRRPLSQFPESSRMSEIRYDLVLAKLDHASVYHMPVDGEENLIDAAEQSGFAVFRVDLTGINNKVELLKAIGQAMQFPEWFGHNWDALLDCLADLGWRPAEGYLIILEHCDGIHGRAEADFVQTLQIFEHAANEWREQGIPFWCFVDMQADGINWLSDIG